MNLFELLRTKRQERIEAKIDRTALRVSRLIKQDVEEGKPGPFVRGIGESPLSMEPEAFVHQVRDKLHEELGQLGIANQVRYDPVNTQIACSENGTLRFDSWPQDTRSNLSIAFARTSN